LLAFFLAWLFLLVLSGLRAVDIKGLRSSESGKGQGGEKNQNQGISLHGTTIQEL
jgi:hypothetical protein